LDLEHEQSNLVLEAKLSGSPADDQPIDKREWRVKEVAEEERSRKKKGGKKK
jgi:hypothetical protein